ncbi:hypothetical protein AURDEDRAFT_178341 [Auricularia subglabra TFB-10046 SS5]|uniref:Uncharacterized protein n=1 Tax=Auricularia subglabra (strain TFB-10046 / SS5) TaxID=717982 RepID=J0L8C1_AURST|nr:hypothetical protein AURDEDRAFT_178341 [Auricularia subglabra TFB-10046 SS5]
MEDHPERPPERTEQYNTGSNDEPDDCRGRRCGLVADDGGHDDGSGDGRRASIMDGGGNPGGFGGV